MSASLRILSRIARIVFAFALASPILTIDPAAGQSGPVVVVNPDPARPGEIVTISGSGFQPGEFVWIDFAGPTLATAVADPSGAFVATGVVDPFVPPGAHPLDANGDMGSWATIDLSIKAPSPATVPAFPDVMFLDGVQAGDLVLITGSGFQASEHVELHYAGDVIGFTIATFSGDFAVQALVPTHVPVGAHPLDVVGDLGSHVGATLTVSVAAPTTTVAPTSTTTTTTLAPASTTTVAPSPSPDATAPSATRRVTAQPWSVDEPLDAGNTGAAPRRRRRLALRWGDRRPGGRPDRRRPERWDQRLGDVRRPGGRIAPRRLVRRCDRRPCASGRLTPPAQSPRRSVGRPKAWRPTGSRTRAATIAC